MMEKSPLLHAAGLRIRGSGRILHESGTAAIIATHDRIEALRVVERLAVMEDG